MAYVPTLKTQYKEQIVAALMKEFGYSSVMQCPKLEKIVINQGMGQAVADKKLIDVAQEELTLIAGQKAVQTRSRKDISNFKLRKGMPIGVRVTLRDTKMYEFLERLIAVALPRIRDFKGINEKFDGQGNYTLGITEQIIFPDKPITKKPAEVRMGKGKGNPEGFVAPVTPGRILFEAEGVPLAVAQEALRLGAQKLPITTKFIVRRDYVETSI